MSESLQAPAFKHDNPVAAFGIHGSAIGTTTVMRRSLRHIARYEACQDPSMRQRALAWIKVACVDHMCVYRPSTRCAPMGSREVHC